MDMYIPSKSRGLFMNKPFSLFAIIILLPIYYSCTTISKTEHLIPETTNEENSVDIKVPQTVPDQQELLLTFAGDIMAHTVNFTMNNYSLIYEDISNILLSDSLSFANMETPVHNGRPYETYPTFNVQQPYALAAINAGFDVFSLANNHTNDQDAEGIDMTAQFFAEQPVYAAGIKQNPDSTLSYQLIDKDGWKILFVAVTEILNSFHDIERIDYIPPTQTGRDAFRSQLELLREENPCDLFIVSIHTNEAEYIPDIQPQQREFYYSLLDSGVDIIWANHPHIAKEWEVITDHQTGTKNKLIMYALGNTISGQRTNPNLQNPGANRDYTGDGYLIQVRFIKQTAMPEFSISSIPPTIIEVKPMLITTYITPEQNYVIKLLNEQFIHTLRTEQRSEYADYFTQRMQLMHQIGEKNICR